MKIFLCGALLFPCIIMHSSATNVGLSTIEQPVNLVAKSDPGSIPLGQVVCETNYNYGIHLVISEARLCRHGVMIWKGGNELNQNLASVFGISVEPKDPTNVPYDPVIIRVKAWKKPAYSPYSKEQVVAATLHCLLRSVAAGKKYPLRIEVVTEDAKDADWAKKYTKPYINVDEENKPLATPTPVPGTRLNTDRYGVTHVIFTGHKDEAKLVKPDVMIAAGMDGGDNDEGGYAMIPVWTGSSKQPSSVTAAVLRCGLYYDLFNSASSIRADANTLPSDDNYFSISQRKEGNTTNIFLSVGGVPEHDLAAALYGIILTIQPTAEKPLEITLHPTSWKHDKLGTFVAAKGWEKKERSGSASLSCKFALDPKTGKLTLGSLPQVRIEKSKRGNYWTKDLSAGKNPGE